MGYGFSLFKNSSDHCNLALGAMAVARVKAMYKHQQSKCGPSATRLAEDVFSDRSVTGVGWVRLVHNAIERADTKSSQQNHLFSPRFLAHASMAFSNTSEQGCGYSAIDTHLFATTMTRNKLHTVCATAMILQKQYMEILVKNVDLPAWPENSRQFHAARYRRGQILVLHAITKSIIMYLRGLVGLEQSSLRDKRIIRLGHILKAGPKDFLQDFRAVLHVGFGTRNAERIRQQRLLDSAFTLWLCGLWLWTCPASKVEGPDPPRAALPLRTAKWIHFARTTYGEDSDIGRRWDELPASEEGRSLAENCQCILEAAAEKNPQSFYNCPEANTDRLLWCYRVILEESFMSPDLEGQAGDDNDEIMLFLKEGPRPVQQVD